MAAVTICSDFGSDSLQPHGLQPARLLCSLDSPGKNNGVSCHALLQGIFLTQELNPGLLHCSQILYQLNSNTLATWCKELTHLKRPWCWERLKVGGEGDDRGWDGWMASLTQWTWVGVNSRSWWWTGRPGVLQSVGSQRVGHDWATELNWTELNWNLAFPSIMSVSNKPMLLLVIVINRNHRFHIS